MKTLIIAIILGVVAHSAAGMVFESETAQALKDRNAQIELTKGL
jgi:hypothetical protein